jgi:hypothetical protein
MPASMADLTETDASSGETFMTTIPPNPSTDNISPVLPRDRFSNFPSIDSLVRDDRSGGNKLIAGAIIAVVLIKSRRFIITVFKFFLD